MQHYAFDEQSTPIRTYENEPVAWIILIGLQVRDTGLAMSV